MASGSVSAVLRGEGRGGERKVLSFVQVFI